MKFISLIFILFITSCSHYQKSEDNEYSSPLTRNIANKKNRLSQLSALKRLEILAKHIRKTRRSLPTQGDPTYYLFENFEERVSDILRNLQRDKHSSMRQKVFIPRDEKRAKSFLRLITAFLVMQEASIFTASSSIAPETPNRAKKFLISLFRAMQNYTRDMEGLIFEGPFVLKIEDKELALSKERAKLIQYLARRVERYSDQFIRSKKARRSVALLLKRINKIPIKNINSITNALKKIRSQKIYRTAKRYFNTINLPDSGSIDGAEESFEMVMSVQFSFELLDFVIQRQIRQ